MDEEREGCQSAITRIVTPKAYEYNRVIDRLDQHDHMDRKRTDAVLMREDTTIDTNSSASEVKVKNVHVQEVEEWIARTVKETILGYIKSKALERAVEKDIMEIIASWNWEIDLEESCPGIKKTNVAMAIKTKVSSMVCFETVREVVKKDIVNAVNFEEIKAPVIETIMKNKATGEEVAGRVDK
jgi:hypothetical protein